MRRFRLRLDLAARLQPTIALLDEGMLIYRRNFLAFLLIAAVWVVPIAILGGLLIAVAAWLETGWIVLIVAATLVLSVPLLIYLIGTLSRAAAAAIEGRAVRLREAVAIRPSRIAGMGCFTMVYFVMMQAISSAVSMVCICPAYILTVGVALALSGSASGSMVEAIVLALIGLIFGGVYLVAVVVGGASYSSLFYALQPWVQEPLSFGEAFSRSIDMVFYRVGRNIVAWGLAALLVAAGGLAVTTTIGLVVPLPLLLLLGDESRVAQAIATAAWTAGFALVLPPLPIWMALLYRRNREARDARDLVARVARWSEGE